MSKVDLSYVHMTPYLCVYLANAPDFLITFQNVQSTSVFSTLSRE